MTDKKYNQLRAMLAITKGGLISMMRSPSAVVFSIGFPLVFILVFGFLGGGGSVGLNVAFSPKCDTVNEVYLSLRDASGLVIKEKPEKEIKEDLEKGRLTAIIDIQKTGMPSPEYSVHLLSSDAVIPGNIFVLQSLINAEIGKLNHIKYPGAPSVAYIDRNVEKIPGRPYRMIDFILPGQLGFSLLSAGIFGVAFLFFNLRQQLVLKRFFATPISKTSIILGEAFSRVIFQMSTAIVIIGMGVLFFHFTLVHGLITFLEIMILSFIALVVFMGCGFIVSGIAKTESTIPPVANLFTLPQFLLSGTFFPTDNFPKWLQPICNALPLTQFNNAMRNLAFEGSTLLSSWKEIGILLIWGVIVYAIAAKTFRWE
jgi:ABC-2 type transport system permease protein